MSQERIPVMVNINNREELNTFLNKLTEDTEARWGLMKPQHMIEHLVKTLQHSNGKKRLPKSQRMKKPNRQKKVLYIQM
jgi:oxepin-CoA hydrolase/3-oxo-5,6-dehydrosuberyl-CoA semialdehyde dehydrogenase